MKKVLIKKLELHNFKKAKHQVINFQDSTEISGDNEKGKTTINDSFTWLLFGKNSENSSDFDLKTLDENNTPIHNLDHSVEGKFSIDGEQLILKRIYKEDWTKKRGSEFSELTGHTTTYFVNNVPCSATEYKKQVNLIIDEELSKILSSPLYFNTKILWNERRNILTQMAGEISNDLVLDTIGQDDFDLIELLNAGKNLDDEKKIMQANKKRCKDELDLIPSRIDEVERSKPVTLNFDELQSNLETNEKKIIELDEQILDKSKAQEVQQKEIQEIQTVKFQKEQQLSRLKNDLEIERNKNVSELKIELSNVNHDLSVVEQKIKNCNSNINTNKSRIDILNHENANLRGKWETENAREFKMNQFDKICPTCSREIDDLAGKMQKMQIDFNSQKKLLSMLKRMRKEILSALVLTWIISFKHLTRLLELLKAVKWRR